MKFEETGDAEHPHRLTFEGDEVETVRAAFREEIHNLARKGNVGSISDYDATVAGWEDESQAEALRVCHYTSITDRLEGFHFSTDDAIVEVTEVSGVPAFDNEDIYRRYQLGQRALELAAAIHQAATPEGRAEILATELAEYLEEHDRPQ